MKGEQTMKKLFFVLLVALALFVGCNKEAKLKAGVYGGSSTFGDSTCTCKVTIDDAGKITNVYFDESYEGSTKKTLGDDYQMKSDWGSKWEWYEHAKALEDAIVANQGIDFITVDPATGKTDAVSGCTIKVDNMLKSYEAAIAKAK